MLEKLIEICKTLGYKNQIRSEVLRLEKELKDELNEIKRTHGKEYISELKLLEAALQVEIRKMTDKILSK